ncbi:MAG TPA: hypothetical protein VEJ22_03010, partial [Nitrospirota bacterium]|nr:hypothetical protein [Nitrospirota bacterium]
NFLRIIKDKGYAYAAGSTLDQMLQRSDKSPLSIYYPLSARMSVRLRDIVADDQGAEDAKWLSAGTRAALLAANTLIDNEQPLDWTRATVPPDQSKLWYVLPHELSVNVVNGGALLSWEPRVNWNDLRSLNFKITPYVPDSSDDKVFRMSQLDVYYTEKRKYETISSWGVGPSVYFPWDSYQKPTGILNHVGASAYVGIIGDKFRMTIGWRNIHASDYPAPSHNFYLLLGVTDIPGISYWFFSK